jgi:hypothetical protein
MPRAPERRLDQTSWGTGSNRPRLGPATQRLANTSAVLKAALLAKIPNLDSFWRRLRRAAESWASCSVCMTQLLDLAMILATMSATYTSGTCPTAGPHN